MYCIECGTKLGGRAAFCHMCGVEAPATSVADSAPPQAGRRFTWLIMAVVVLAVGGAGLAGGFLLGRSDDGSETELAQLPLAPIAGSPAVPRMVPITATPIAATPTVEAPTGVVKAGDRVTILNSGGDSIRLRVTPSMIAVTFATVPNGSSALVTRGPATAEGYTWYEIETSEGTGWTRSDFLKRS